MSIRLRRTAEVFGDPPSRSSEISEAGVLERKVFEAVLTKNFKRLCGAIPDPSSPKISTYLGHLDDDFFRLLEKSGCITLSDDVRSDLVNIVYAMLVCQHLHPLNRRRSLGRVAQHARACRSAIMAFAPGSANWMIPGCRDQAAMCADLEKIVVWSEAVLILADEKRDGRTGRPPKTACDLLANLLLVLYERAQGKVTLNAGADGVTAGPCAAFLRLFWESLPEEVTEGATAETFVRRAKRSEFIKTRKAFFVLLGDYDAAATTFMLSRFGARIAIERRLIKPALAHCVRLTFFPSAAKLSSQDARQLAFHLTKYSM